MIRFFLVFLGLILKSSQVSCFSLDSHWTKNHAVTRWNPRLESVETSQSYEMETEQRNLRFSGVGRLYTSGGMDTTALDTEPHLDVIERLSKATVVVVGLGGVGSWAAEALCRSGIGNLILIDLDDICISNTNRQLHALSSTVGKMKIDEMKRRLLDINPACNISLIHDFVSEDNIDDIFTSIPGVTACLDAIDGSIGKSSLIAACARHRIPIVTCGGSAGRSDPTKIVCDDLTKITCDRLLSSCRKMLRQTYGFEHGKPFSEIKKGNVPRKWRINAVYSLEPQKKLPGGSDSSSLRRCDGALGTACFVTGTCGFVAAGQVVDMIAKDCLVVPRNFKGNVKKDNTISEAKS